MKGVLHVPDFFSYYQRLRDHMQIDRENYVSLGMKNDDWIIDVKGYNSRTFLLYAKIGKNRVGGDFIAKGMPISCGSAFYGKILDDMSINCSLSSPGFVYPNRTNLDAYFPRNVVSIHSNYTTKLFTSGLGFGMDSQKALSALFTLNTRKFSYSLKGTAIGNVVNMETSFLNSFGLILYVSCNPLRLFVNKLLFGYFKDHERVTAHLIMDPIESKVWLGGIIKYSDSTTVSTKCKYCIASQSLQTRFCLDSHTKNRFRGSLSSNGTLKMQTNFFPREWLKITIQSCSSIKTGFKPVSLTWSLSFTPSFNMFI